MTAHRTARALVAAGVAVAVACQPSETPPTNEGEDGEAASVARPPSVQAMNVFYY